MIRVEEGAIRAGQRGHVVTNLQVEASVPRVFDADDDRQCSNRQFANAVCPNPKQEN